MMELHPILEKDEIPTHSKMWYVISAGGCASPSMRVGHSGISLPSKTSSKVLLLGGANPSGVFPENHLLDLGSYEWKEVPWTGLKGRYEHAAFIPTTEDDKVYVFGGADQSGNLNDLQVLDLETGKWSSVVVSGEPPSPRTCRASAWCSDQLYVFSGGEQGTDPVADSKLHVFNSESISWKQPEVTGEVPNPRHGHATVAIGTKLYLHGGMARDIFHDELYEFDTVTSAWKQIKCSGDVPPGMAAHGAVGFEQKIIVFGGMIKNGVSDITYILNTENFHWKKVELNGPPPASRLDHAMCIVTMATSHRKASPKETATEVTDQAPTGIVNITEDAMFVVDGVQQRLSTDEQRVVSGKDEDQPRKPGSDSETKHSQTLVSPGASKLGQESDPKGAVSCLTENGDDDVVVCCVFVHGGMDVSGQIFDDCLVMRLDDL